MGRLFLEREEGKPLSRWLELAKGAVDLPDVRELNPLQLAYIGDTLHDLFVRSLLLSRRLNAGAMHRQAIRMVSAGAQAAMLQAIASDLTQEEADAVRRGRNAQAKHAAPRNQDPADYAHATGLEALWGYLYVTGRVDRLSELMTQALSRTEDIWHRQNSR